ncbi:metal ABC transporter ATP-binding protein [Carboxydothermus pertinax]|uniref:ABC transporter domain-containing protein n=1 Tax=Carboxydothermus pertinax TaxID=870242 RepID=A0A1L8CVM2_9THEO|nr:ATP-binding cassette domain-containing protein [Carboxydothermus pertinax]GAV22947.1 hypothetical protein cpu_14570 [Carboxydothermus pertinax]
MNLGLLVEDLTVNYGDELSLKNINFSLKDGDFLLVLGKNGAGKSTLLKAITGEISYAGNINTFNHKIGYVAQKLPQTIKFPVTVEELVLTGTLKGKPKLFYSKEDREIAEKALKATNLLAKRKKLLGNLSGGELRRAFIARALAGKADLLLLDEPTSGLDQRSREELYQVLNNFFKENTIVLMVTHDPREIKILGNKILHLEKQILYFGAKDRYLAGEEKDLGVECCPE